MSEVRVNNIVDYGGKGAPTFDNGAVISGVGSLGNQAKIGSNVTITSGGINVSGVTTAATLSGNLTGDVNSGFVTATSAVIGSGVTINAGGFNITGVVTATTFKGDGSTMTGVANTITPLVYNPDVSDSTVPKATGIGITFDHRIIAGSGNVTLSIATNAGAAGTTVENFAVGSDVTIAGRKASIDPTSDLNQGETYHISYPSGCFTNTHGDVDYVGTAYTFGVKPVFTQFWVFGNNEKGQLGDNSRTHRSSPIQIPGTNWAAFSGGWYTQLGVRSNGTLWAWGENDKGQLGQNNVTLYSSPVQIPGTNWSQSIDDIAETFKTGTSSSAVIKTDGTLWAWGENTDGELGQNSVVHYSSPVQIPGTTWNNVSAGGDWFMATKTDNTLWMWGDNGFGALGQNQAHAQLGAVSSPVQIPGTTWDMAYANKEHTPMAIKTDGTLWLWGGGGYGVLAQNNTNIHHSSPVQVPGTTWSKGAYGTARASVGAIKTDGTLWRWGRNYWGGLGINESEGGSRSSPIQVPGTWSSVSLTYLGSFGLKTNGELWAWGQNDSGQLGQNNTTKRSSPVQVGSDTNWSVINSSFAGSRAIKEIG